MIRLILWRIRNRIIIFRRGWLESDLHSLDVRINNAVFYNGGILKVTRREWRALPELNRRIKSQKPNALLYPVLLWVEGFGLRQERRAE